MASFIPVGTVRSVHDEDPTPIDSPAILEAAGGGEGRISSELDGRISDVSTPTIKTDSPPRLRYVSLDDRVEAWRMDEVSYSLVDILDRIRCIPDALSEEQIEALYNVLLEHTGDCHVVDTIVDIAQPDAMHVKGMRDVIAGRVDEVLIKLERSLLHEKKGRKQLLTRMVCMMLTRIRGMAHVYDAHRRSVKGRDPFDMAPGSEEAAAFAKAYPDDSSRGNPFAKGGNGSVAIVGASRNTVVKTMRFTKDIITERDACHKETGMFAVLDDPGFAEVHGWYVDKDKSGGLLIRMPMAKASGKDLIKHMMRLPKKRMTIEETGSVLKQLHTRVHTLHKRGIIGWDLKPENFVIDSKGTVVTVDAGNTFLEGSETSGYCTPLYTHPDALSTFWANKNVVVKREHDEWLLGMMAYSLATGSHLVDRKPGWSQKAALQAFYAMHTKEALRDKILWDVFKWGRGIPGSKTALGQKIVALMGLKDELAGGGE